MVNDLSDLTPLYLRQELEKSKKPSLLTPNFIDNICPMLLNFFLYVVFAWRHRRQCWTLLIFLICQELFCWHSWNMS